MAMQGPPTAAYQLNVQRMVCIACGAEAHVSCGCGKPYVPAAQRVAEYDKANPGRSTRDAAADLGVHHSRVGRARQRDVAGATPEPEAITGRDGKTYSPRKRITGEEGIDIDVAVIEGRRIFLRLAADMIRKAEQGGGLQNLNGPDITDDIVKALDDVIAEWTKLRDDVSHRRKRKNGKA